MTEDGSEIITTGGVSGPNKMSRCWKISLWIHRKWTTMPDLNIGRLRHTSLCTGNKAYVLGGLNEFKDSVASDDYFDDEPNSWKRAGAPMPRGTPFARRSIIC